MIDVYWILRSRRHLGHLVVGLYSMVCVRGEGGGMARIVCTSHVICGFLWALWLYMVMVVVELSSWQPFLPNR